MKKFWKDMGVIAGIVVMCLSGRVMAETPRILPNSEITGCYVDYYGSFYEFTENGKFMLLDQGIAMGYKLIEDETTWLELEYQGETVNTNVWLDENGNGLFMEIEEGTEKILFIRVDEEEFWDYLIKYSNGEAGFPSSDIFQKYAQQRMLENQIFDFDKLMRKFTFKDSENGEEYLWEITYATAERAIVDYGEGYWVAEYEDSSFHMDGSVGSINIRPHEGAKIRYAFDETGRIISATIVTEDNSLPIDFVD